MSSINAELILRSLSKFISNFYLMKKLNWVTKGTFMSQTLKLAHHFKGNNL